MAKSQKHNHEPSHTYYDKVVTRKTPEDSLRNILEELNPQKAIAEPKYLETDKPWNLEHRFYNKTKKENKYGFQWIDLQKM